MEITVVDTGKNSCKKNMAIDAFILSNLDTYDLPVLHFYDWDKPSLTYGYFSKIEALLNMQAIEKEGIGCAKRLTGGGVTLHFCDLAFSFLMPKSHSSFSNNALQNYYFVNKTVSKALEKLVENPKQLHYYDPQKENSLLGQQFCMAKPTKYDVLYEGLKIAGAAQRKTAKGYLHHGTISIKLPDLKLLKKILLSQEVVSAMKNNTFTFRTLLKSKSLPQIRNDIKQELIKAFQDCK